MGLDTGEVRGWAGPGADAQWRGLFPPDCGAGVGAKCPRQMTRPRRKTRRRSLFLSRPSQMTLEWRTWTSVTRVRGPSQLRVGRGAGTRAQGPEGGSEPASPVSTRGGRSFAIRVPRGAGGGRGGAGAAEAAGEGAAAAATAAVTAAARQR